MRRAAGYGLLSCAIVTLTLGGAILSGSPQQQGNRPAGTHQDNTPGPDWIKRLERPDRIPGLRIEEVIQALGLKPGMAIADIGAGTGAYTIPFAAAVAPSGRAYAVDIWPELLDYIKGKCTQARISNLVTVLAALDDPKLPKGQVDIAFFHDVFHNTNDRQAYLRTLVSELKPTGRIAIIEQEFNDPIAIRSGTNPKIALPPSRCGTGWPRSDSSRRRSFDTFKGKNNPPGTGMPERWFVVYGRK